MIIKFIFLYNGEGNYDKCILRRRRNRLDINEHAFKQRKATHTGSLACVDTASW